MSEPYIFCDAVENALLHLYFTIAESSRFVPLTKRNEILVRYLKPLVKDKAYRSARKELRSLLYLGKQPSCNLEAKLVELNDISHRYDKNAIDARLLFYVLGQIESQFGLPTRFINYLNGEQPKSETIYMVQEHIENGFVESGEQVAPISLFIESEKVVSVVKFINDRSLFGAELQQVSEDAKQSHIVLHPNKFTKEGEW